MYNIWSLAHSFYIMYMAKRMDNIHFDTKWIKSKSMLKCFFIVMVIKILFP